MLGLAGSGKTHHAENIAAATGAAYLEGTEGDRRDSLLAALSHHLRNGTDCVVEEIAYCSSQFRERIELLLRAQVPDVAITWICLENDLESANWNVQHRTNKGDVPGHLAINAYWHSRYSYPAGAPIIPITRIVD